MQVPHDQAHTATWKRHTALSENKKDEQGIHEPRSGRFLKDSVLFFKNLKHLKNMVPLQYYSLLGGRKQNVQLRKAEGQGPAC